MERQRLINYKTINKNNMATISQWTEKGSYTTQTKTLWYLAKLHFELATAGLFKFTNEIGRAHV